MTKSSQLLGTLRLLSGIRVFSREGGKQNKQTKPHPFYPGSETRSHSQDPKGQVLGPRVIRVRTYWLSMGSVRMCVCAVTETIEVGVATPESVQHTHSNEYAFV